MADILEQWSYRSPGEVTTVLPDGCRDIIWQHSPGQKPQWFASPLQRTPKRVVLASATLLIGFRLPPGTPIDSRAVETLPETTFGVQECIANWTSRSPRVVDALSALALAPSVSEAARMCGVHERTLHRCLVAETQQSPVFWNRLARARRAAARLRGGALASVATESGYADQAHMSREIRSWFGLPPGRLRARSDLLQQISQPGFATGEQISTKYPSGSLT